MAERFKLAYTSPEDMQAAVDAYFEDCEGHEYIDAATGLPAKDKFGYPIIVGKKPLTVTGLALALGFNSRMSLLNYQNRNKKYNEIITRAKLKIENYAEMRLYDKDGSNGAKFNLQNNFRAWDADKAKDDDKGLKINIINDLPKPVEGGIELPNVAQMSIDPQAIAEAQEQLKQHQTTTETDERED